MTVLTLICVLVIAPALIGYALYAEMLWQQWSVTGSTPWRRGLTALFHHGFEPGDFLLYRKTKVSQRPGPRARNVQPAQNGDDYSYEVVKFWRLANVLPDGRLLAVTRTGKEIFLTPSDSNLRKARIVDVVLHRTRFPRG
jgi:hypothetical protein